MQSNNLIRFVKGFNCILAVCAFLMIAAGCKTYHSNQKSEREIPYKWKLGSSTSLIKELNPAILQEVKQSGIDFLEIGWKDLNRSNISFTERLAYAQKVYSEALDAGIIIWSTHVPYGADFDISNLDDARRKKTLALIKEYIDLAVEMKAKQLVLHPSEPFEESTRKQRIINCRESLKELVLYVKGKGIKIAIETLPPNFLGSSSHEMLEILNDIDDVEICFDTNHLYPEKPEDFVRAVGKRISTVHISDFDGVQQKHWMPGKGAINWNKVIDELVKIDYKAPFMYEVVRRENEQHTFKDLKANFDGLKSSWLKNK